MLRLVLATCYELDRLDVEDLSPARFILEHGLEHRLGLAGRSEELDDLFDLVGDDGVEDHAPTIGQGVARVFGLFRRVAYSFALATAGSDTELNPERVVVGDLPRELCLRESSLK